MNVYLVGMLAGSAVIFALYGLVCAKYARRTQPVRRPWLTAALSFVFSLIFGVILARLTYALLMQELDFEYDGIEALEELLHFEISNVSFFGGAVGVFLGVLLANRIAGGRKKSTGMDIFAPFGALLVALFRTGEVCYGSYGAGDAVPQGSPFGFFPFALRIEVDGGYSYWGWNICMLSAVFAVICAVCSFILLNRHGRAWLVTTFTAFFLALPQILCESLRKRGMFWLFVHAEQVICVVVVVGMLLIWIIGSGSKLTFARRWLPLLLALLCLGMIIPLEFAIDGKLFDIPHWICYVVMVLVLAATGVIGVITAKRWNAEKKAA